jgi:hypothetical protein
VKSGDLVTHNLLCGEMPKGAYDFLLFFDLSGNSRSALSRCFIQVCKGVFASLSVFEFES